MIGLGQEEAFAGLDRRLLPPGRAARAISRAELLEVLVPGRGLGGPAGIEPPPTLARPA